jgi:sulfite exporter TauE/SafE
MSKMVRSGMAIAMALGLLALLPAFADESQGDRVVVTRPGVVFHKAGAEDIRGRAVEKTVDAALEAGYMPCPVCFAKEITAARAGSTALPGAAATATFGDGSIPAPPVSTVVQPFGLRFATNAFRSSPKEAIQNPYDDLYRVVPGRAEQGAFGER